MNHQLSLPLQNTDIQKLRAGDVVELSGVLYTARDQAHQRIEQLMQEGKPLPFPLRGATIYYVGPCPHPPEQVIGACGPTTSYRVDSFTPNLIAHGLKGMIGKGARGKEVVDAMVKYGAVYFSATGGAGALLASKVKSCRVVAFPELLSEAVHQLEVDRFPVIVAIDAQGNSLYERR